MTDIKIQNTRAYDLLARKLHKRFEYTTVVGRLIVIICNDNCPSTEVDLVMPFHFQQQPCKEDVHVKDCR